MPYLIILAAMLITFLPGFAAAQDDAFDAWSKANTAAESHEFATAIKLATKARAMGFSHRLMDYHLGRWQFQSGNAALSVEHFDAYLKQSPHRAASLWERGISCYYAGDYQAGAKQFEDYQTYHNNDVENAVWRYLCQARVEGKAKARAAMLPIRHDPRIPMMSVYQLFRGELQPDAVLQAATSSKSTGDQRKVETMHAHLYLGLYYDSEGDITKAQGHLEKATQQFKRGPYMWSVAVVHRQQLKEQVDRQKRSTSAASPDSPRP